MLLVVVGLIALSGLSVSVAAPVTTADQTAPPQNTSEEHTVVIETRGDPVQYTLTASGTVDGDANESDTVQGRTLNGRIGGVPWNNTTNDTEDTVRYTGYIQTFQHRGDDLQLLLDGEPVSPATLSGNHLTIVHPNSSNDSPTTPISYEISVTGDAVPGESTENQDGTATENGSNGTLIQGELSDQSDSFYFTGNTTGGSVDKASVFVNGRNATVSNTTNETPEQTPAPPTATDNRSPTTTAASPPGTTGPEPTTTVQSPTDTNGSVSSESSGSVFGFLLRLGSGIVVVALAATVAWYYFPRQERW